MFGPPGTTVIDTKRDHLLRVDLQTWSAEVLPLPEPSAGGEFFRQRFQFADSGDLVLMGDGLFQNANSVVSAYHGGRWTQDTATLRHAYGIRADFGAPGEGLVGFDPLGQELWRDDNVSPTGNEGFRLATSGAVTVISGCVAPPDPNGCVEYSLVGIETETGTILWQIPGLRGFGGGALFPPQPPARNHQRRRHQPTRDGGAPPHNPGHDRPPHPPHDPAGLRPPAARGAGGITLGPGRGGRWQRPTANTPPPAGSPPRPATRQPTTPPPLPRRLLVSLRKER